MTDKNTLQWLNIAPMLPDHVEELAGDIRKMYERKSITETAFIFTLNPEGDPPVNKAEILAERYLKYKEALKGCDMPVGILIQATMGHGWTPNSQSHFQRFVKPDGSEPYIFCPLDREFQAYIRTAIRRCASLKPDFMMVDDDFRMLTCRGGCFCPLHLGEFNRREHAEYTRESLLKACEENPAVAARYDELLKESMVQLARVLRESMDEVDPSIPCSFCTCSQDTRHAPAVAAALATAGQKKTVRINHAMYLNESLRNFPVWLRYTCRQIADFPEDYKILAEPDTFPHNRYSVSATHVHALLTHSILAGARGGKLWLTRTQCYEPASGRAFNEILSRHHDFYQALADLKIRWTGIDELFPQKPAVNFPETFQPHQDDNLNCQIFGKMGFPIYFSNQPGNIVAIANRDVDALPDDELLNCLQTSNCIIDGTAAVGICKRGFGALLGVDARPWDDLPVTFERDCRGRFIPCHANLPMAKLAPAEGTTVFSTFYHREGGISEEADSLSPAIVIHGTPQGKTMAVMATPVVPYFYPSFTLLNETRKQQFLELFSLLGGLEWYTRGDHEVMLRTGRLEDGDLVVVTNTLLDPMPAIDFGGSHAEQVTSMKRLNQEGAWEDVSWSKTADGVQVDLTLGPLNIAVLKATF